MEACSSETAPIISILYWPSLAIPFAICLQLQQPVFSGVWPCEIRSSYTVQKVRKRKAAAAKDLAYG